MLIVTVLMSVYNNGTYLTQAVDSILKQTWTAFEFLIIDDGSTDDSSEILKQYAEHEPRIRLIKNTQNMGLTDSLNLGLAQATGDYIVRMDGDDISLPNRLEMQLRFMETNTDVALCGTACQAIDVNGKQLETYTYPTESNILKWSLCFYDPFVHPSVITKREVILATGGYSQRYLVAQDYELWCRLAQQTQLANLPQSLLFLRRHKNNVSTIYSTKQQQNSLKISRDYINQLLNIQIDHNLIQQLWFPAKDAIDHAWKAINLIGQLHQYFMDKQNIPSYAKREISEDATGRIYNQAIRSQSTIVGHYAVQQIMRQIWRQANTCIDISKADKNLLKMSIADKVYALSRNNLGDVRNWSTIAWAWRADPGIGWRTINRLTSRFRPNVEKTDKTDANCYLS